MNNTAENKDYKRVIPCLDVKDGRVVKGVNFVNLKDIGDPVLCAKYYAFEGADELVFLDITATVENRPTVIEMAADVAGAIEIPYAVGGGFKDINDISKMLAAGANKVSIGSAALANSGLITQAAALFGSDAIICAIDAKKIAGSRDKWEVYINGGNTATGIDAVEFAVVAAKLGAGEILLTSMDHDGVKDGYDLALTAAVADAVEVPVTASGGVGKLEHFAQGILEGKASAVLAASVFHERTFSIREVKEYMAAQGICVRM